MAGLPAALYIGNCTGHGFGCGALHHPGFGGGTLPDCPHAPMTPTIQARPILPMNATVTWAPHPQLPLSAGAIKNVIINGQVPITDLEDLIPHPTVTTLTTISAQGGTPPCFNVQQTPAYWCVIGTGPGGRESPTGHSRRLYATTKTVFINGRRAGRMADPLGFGTAAAPCTSRIAGASANVFIGV